MQSGWQAHGGSNDALSDRSSEFRARASILKSQSQPLDSECLHALIGARLQRPVPTWEMAGKPERLVAHEGLPIRSSFHAFNRLKDLRRTATRYDSLA